MMLRFFFFFIGIVFADERSYESLMDQASHFEYVEHNRVKAIEIYRSLYACDPNNPDVLFHLGKLLSQEGKWNEAETLLQKCLMLAPQYTDAALQIATIYLWQGKLNEAQAIYSKYPTNIEAKEGLAKVLFREKKYAEAETLYEKVLQEDPSRIETRKCLALDLLVQHKYRAAKKEYKIITRAEPKERDQWRRAFETRSHTDVSLSVKGFYVESKEDDPTLHAPVAKTYYDFVTSSAYIPICDLFRVDIKAFVLKQKENNIYRDLSTNYSVLMNAGEISFRYQFLQNWKWNLNFRGLRAGDIAIDPNYPFQDTSRFEPGTSVVYEQDCHALFLATYIESFIIKDYTISQSELLRMNPYEIAYLYRRDIAFHPELCVWLNEVFYHDNLHNRRDEQGIQGRISLFPSSKFITVGYRFQHRHFKKLNPNYFSYKQQYFNMLGIELSQEVLSGITLDLIYERSYQNTYQLYQPIGTFIFVANSQYLQGNQITGQILYQWQDHLQVMAEGHYFRNTLPYREWGVKFAMVWQF